MIRDGVFLHYVRHWIPPFDICCALIGNLGISPTTSSGAIGLCDEDVAQQQEHGGWIGKERMALLARDHAAKGRENDPPEGEMGVTIVRSYATQDARPLV